MRFVRLALVLLFLFPALTPAATTDAFDPLVAAVTARRSALDPEVPRERRQFKALGRVARELSAPAASLADDLGIAARTIRAIRRNLRKDAELAALASTALDDLGADAAFERRRLALWIGRLELEWREERLAEVLAAVDGHFIDAAEKTSGTAEAKALAKGCAAMDAVRSELVILGDPPAMPDFLIPDVNPASSRFSENVSPRDYVNKISAWYFGKAG